MGWDAGKAHLLDGPEREHDMPTEKVGELPRDRTVAFVCRSGHRSLLAARRARRGGVDVVSVKGGMLAWKEAGLPTATPTRHDAQEAAREGIELRALHARIETQLDMSRALGASEHPPVQRIDWHLDVDADASPERLEAIRQIADERCPGAWCLRNPLELHTHLKTAETD